MTLQRLPELTKVQGIESQLKGSRIEKDGINIDMTVGKTGKG
jgi:hypothetical protein